MLSKGIQKRAEQWAEDTGKDVSQHLRLCYKHYKETVAADMAGVEDAMTVTLTGGRSYFPGTVCRRANLFVVEPC